MTEHSPEREPIVQAKPAVPPPVQHIPSPIVPVYQTRLLAAVLATTALTVLGLAAWFKPDPRGFGTHSQLGTGPCGMLVMTGLPCPTCGMTTAFSHTVRGQWIRACYVQPLGFLLALATIATVFVGLWTLIRGRWPRWPHRVISPHRTFLILLILILAAWGWKIVIGLADGSLPYR